MNNKSVLITGVTGQDGSYLAEQLLGEGRTVYGMARRTSTPNTANIAHLLGLPAFHLVEGDITDAGCIARLVNRVTPCELYNLAAQSFVSSSFEEPSHTWDVTARGVLNVLEAVRGLNYKCRVYQASSSEMFGSHSSEFQNLKYQDELTPFAPNSPYAIAKLAGHHLVRVYREAYGLHAVSGILFNHESPRRGLEFVTRKITLWVGKCYVAWLANRELPTISLGNPDASRDWGHAIDYMQAASLMLRADTPRDYVIATGVTHTVREFLREALEMAALPLSIEASHVTWATPALLRPCEVHYLRGDPSLAREALGWQPLTGFTNLVRGMVQADIVKAKAAQGATQC